MRHKRTRRGSVPWITPQIKGLMKSRNYQKKRAIKYGSQSHWEKYQNLRIKVNIECVIFS